MTRKASIVYHLSFILCILLLLLTAASCQKSESPRQERERRARKNKGEIIIGVAAPWAQLAKQKRMYWQGIEMALDEINKGGGVLGRKIRLIKKDDKASLSEGAIVAQDFASNPDLVAVIGHYNSYISIPISDVYEYYGILMLSPLSTAPQLTSRGFKYVFRNVLSDDEIARQLAVFARKRGYDRLMAYYLNNDYGKGLANAFETHATELGLTVVDRLSYDSDYPEAYFKRDLGYWEKNFSFDAIVLVGYVEEGAEIIAEARRLGIKAPIMGGDGLDSPLLWTVGGERVEGTIVATYMSFEDPRPEAQAFKRAFIKRYGENPTGATAQGYDALKLLACSMTQAGTAAPREVAGALGKTRNWMGVSGPVTFNDKGDVVDKPIAIQVVHGKRFEFLKQ